MSFGTKTLMVLLFFVLSNINIFVFKINYEKRSQRSSVTLICTTTLP